VDEIHLLHDDRGPVIESIIARTVRQIEVLSASLGPRSTQHVQCILSIMPVTRVLTFDSHISFLVSWELCRLSVSVGFCETQHPQNIKVFFNFGYSSSLSATQIVTPLDLERRRPRRWCAWWA